MLWTISKNAFEVLFPRVCLVCGKPAGSIAICFRCLPGKIQPASRCKFCYRLATPDFSACQACCMQEDRVLTYQRFIWNYGPETAEIMHAMKMRPCRRLAQILAIILAEAMFDLFPQNDWDLVLPIPPSRAGYSHRGFNQSRILADSAVLRLREFCPDLQVFDALEQSDNSISQKLLTPKQRLGKRLSIGRLKTALPKKAKVLLIDDVVTTGSTSAGAAIALLRAGAERVDLLSVARAANWFPIARVALEN